jgi:hypothetical protein
MLAGDFQHKLRKLNPKLRIFCGDNDARPAGIFRVVRGEYTEICGIDKNDIPEHSIFAPHGAHIKGGWRRALKILINMGLIDRTKAEKIFRTRLHYKSPKRYKLKRDNSLPAQRLG